MPKPMSEGPRTTEQMAAQRRLQQAQEQVDEVVGVMRGNLERLLEREEKLTDLEEQADELRKKGSLFQRLTKKVKDKFWCENLKAEGILGCLKYFAVILLILILLIIDYRTSLFLVKGLCDENVVGWCRNRTKVEEAAAGAEASSRNSSSVSSSSVFITNITLRNEETIKKIEVLQVTEAEAHEKAVATISPAENATMMATTVLEQSNSSTMTMQPPPPVIEAANTTTTTTSTPAPPLISSTTSTTTTSTSTTTTSTTTTTPVKLPDNPSLQITLLILASTTTTTTAKPTESTTSSTTPSTPSTNRPATPAIYMKKGHDVLDPAVEIEPLSLSLYDQ